MNKFVQTMGNITYTENVMPTYKSSLNPHLDLFYRIGNRNANGLDVPNMVHLAGTAAAEDRDLAVKIIGWSRSVRKGAGVRCHMRSMLEAGMFSLSQEIDWSWFGRQGYWKDIFYFSPQQLGVDGTTAVLKAVDRALAEEDNLILKWLPRKKKGNPQHKNSQWAAFIRKYLKLSEKEYRTMVASFKTPETQMCAHEWNEIDYSTVPSKCMIRNRNVFKKHDEERFNSFMKKAAKGEDGATVKAGAVYPHEILKLIIPSDRYCCEWNNAFYNDLAEAQWRNLPNKFSSDKKIMVVGDTSGSMARDDSIYISLALTIYCAEKLTGAFHNFAITFSERPLFIKFTDEMTLDKKLEQIPEILANTNIERVFDMILYHAKAHNVPQEDMPEMVLIISDMQFDYGVENANQNIQQLIQSKYAGTGYHLPSVVYWNVRNSSGVPVTQDERGVALFSGASPNSIKQAIEGEIDPVASMMRVVDNEEFYFLKRN